MKRPEFLYQEGTSDMIIELHCKTKVAKGEDILDWVEQNAWFDVQDSKSKEKQNNPPEQGR